MGCRWFFPLLVCVATASMTGCGGSVSGGNGGGGAASTTVTFTFDSAGAMPSVVAARIGSGAFTQATLSSNVLTLSIPEGTTAFAVAYLCPAYPYYSGGTEYSYNDQYVVEASTEDGTSFSRLCLNPSSVQPQTGTLSGTVDVSAISGANWGYLSVNGAISGQGNSIGNGVTEISVQAPVGSTQVVALASQETESSDSLYGTILAIKDLGEQTVPGVLNGGNPIVFGDADLTTQQPITFQNLPSGEDRPSLGGISFVTAGGGEVSFLQDGNSSYAAVPAAMMHGNARYEFSFDAGDSLASLVEVSMSSNSEGPVTITFPSVWNYSGPTPAVLPAFDLSSYAGFAGTKGVVYEAGESWASPANTSNIYGVTASTSYLNGSQTMAMPDLSNVTGFLTPPSSGTTVSWSANITQNSVGAVWTTPLNSSTQAVTTSGSFVVP